MEIKPKTTVKKQTRRSQNHSIFVLKTKKYITIGIIGLLDKFQI